MSTFADTVTMAETAIVTVRAGGAALTLAIAGAMVEAMWPGVQARTGRQAWEALVWLASMALRLLFLITCGPFILAYRLAVTYLHIGAASARHSLISRGRHRPVYVRTHQASAWQARGVVTA